MYMYIHVCMQPSRVPLQAAAREQLISAAVQSGSARVTMRVSKRRLSHLQGLRLGHRLWQSSARPEQRQYPLQRNKNTSVSCILQVWQAAGSIGTTLPAFIYLRCQLILQQFTNSVCISSRRGRHSLGNLGWTDVKTSHSLQFALPVQRLAAGMVGWLPQLPGQSRAASLCPSRCLAVR